ncbi:hypothetical protein MCW82_07155 [Azospirillum doebereinerae]|uniref:hypothetical protein n=1 Tax=Azospirillum doebereinerae TaxID=92933 RepID=UPI001EE5041D|nr:hypothetical protein [Azospirillum doebereinerae]MCG5239545.1 hypothetical protein [Azospirillum doebereinerae]
MTDLFGGGQPPLGGGDSGRSAKVEVRNPVLGLPAARAIQALPMEQRRPLGILLRELSSQCDAQAEASWLARKGIMAAYWRAVATYSKHLARAIDPRSTGSVLRLDVKSDAEVRS